MTSLSSIKGKVTLESKAVSFNLLVKPFRFSFLNTGIFTVFIYGEKYEKNMNKKNR